ncbi:MAG: TRAP transporter large permease subunit, partial [Proteobacteria bacterium]|nr:TRAP transporter large permease subunit [Pseudomonadota bacterium]
MSALGIGGTGLICLFLLIVLQVPIAFAMMIVGVVGFALQDSWSTAFTFLASEPTRILSSIDMATLPLFLLLGAFANVAGFSDDIYAAAAAFLGHRRGGLAYATIGGSALFGSVCGSTTATAATFGKLALPQMLRRGYSPAFATGTIAGAGTLKSLIPPSLLMILYCIVAKTFILEMFVAALFPALITIAFNVVAIAVTVRLDPAAAPVSPRVPFDERVRVVRRAVPAIILVVTIFGGLYSGMFTINEAASVAAVLALAFAVLRRRLSWRGFVEALQSTAGTAVMLYMILIGASVFTYFITLARLPEALIHGIDNLHLPPLAVIVLLLLSYIVLGTVFEELSAILITLPFVLP